LGFIMDQRLKVHAHNIIQHVGNDIYEWYSSVLFHKKKLFRCRHHRLNISLWIMLCFPQLWFSSNSAGLWFWI
jgi:hypothetical protein